MSRSTDRFKSDVNPMLPLQGIRVVELAQLVSGPYCGSLLAGLGAEVIKIEPPAGDMARQFGPFVSSDSAYFESVNRGKTCVRLDLSTDQGRERLVEYLTGADVLIHNMRLAAARRLGIDAATVRSRFPDLIVCEISAFGADDHSHKRVGVDLVFQAEAGFMHVTGHPGGPPTRGGTNVPDFFAALSATSGVLAALLARERTSRVSTVEVSLLDATLAMQTCWFAAHTAGHPIVKLGNGSVFSSPTGSYETADRDIVISIVHDQHWRILCDVLGASDLPDDPRFITNDLRCQNRQDLDEILQTLFRSRRATEWVATLTEAGLPAGICRNYDEVVGAWSERFDWGRGYAIAPPPFRLTSGNGPEVK